MTRCLTALLLLVGCSVDPQIEDKPCPCAPGFSCVADRCVEGAGSDAGDSDAATDAQVVATFEVDFGQGSHEGTRPGTRGVLTLEEGQAEGTYESAAYDAGRTITMTRLSWVPAAPYAKPLPRARGVETGYEFGPVAMSDNVVLYDFQDVTGIDGARIDDLSGRGNAGLINAGLAVPPVESVVGLGYAFGSGAYLSTSLTNSDDLQLGTTDWTWMAWVRTTENADEENRVFFGMEEGGTTNPHIWFGSRTSCGASPGALGGTLRSAAGTDSSGYCGVSSVFDGQWHLIALTKSGHPDATIRVYVDGTVDAVESRRFDGEIVFSPGESMNYAAFRGGSFPSTVDMAQITVFRRALDEGEVRSAYLRAALFLSVQVRACEIEACDAPFIGPDGTSATTFVDPVENLSPPVEHALSLTGRYFEVEVRLGTSASGEAPVLRSLSLSP